MKISHACAVASALLFILIIGTFLFAKFLDNTVDEILISLDKLPKEAQDYVEFIEKEIGVHVSIVSTGPVREEIIRR